MCMYFLIRNGYCVGVSESLEELEQQRQNDDVIKEMKDEKQQMKFLRWMKKGI